MKENKNAKSDIKCKCAHNVACACYTSFRLEIWRRVA